MPVSPHMRPNSTHQSLVPLRNTKTGDKTIRKIKPHPRKNNQPFVSSTLKFDKSIQVNVEVNTPKMVDSTTQTPRPTTETTQATLMLGSLHP